MTSVRYFEVDVLLLLASSVALIASICLILRLLHMCNALPAARSRVMTQQLKLLACANIIASIGEIAGVTTWFMADSKAAFLKHIHPTDGTYLCQAVSFVKYSGVSVSALCEAMIAVAFGAHAFRLTRLSQHLRNRALQLLPVVVGIAYSPIIVMSMGAFWNQETLSCHFYKTSYALPALFASSFVVCFTSYVSGLVDVYLRSGEGVQTREARRMGKYLVGALIPFLPEFLHKFSVLPPSMGWVCHVTLALNGLVKALVYGEDSLYSTRDVMTMMVVGREAPLTVGFQKQPEVVNVSCDGEEASSRAESETAELYRNALIKEFCPV